MTKELWINLPVKNIAKSKEFFTKLGFTFNEKRSNETMACLPVGSKNVVVMFFAESIFKGFTQNNIADTAQGNEALFSFDAETREEVDEIAKKAEEAGGTLFGKPSDIQGWMYGCGFTDLDGHRWNALYMDMNQMPG